MFRILFLCFGYYIIQEEMRYYGSSRTIYDIVSRDDMTLPLTKLVITQALGLKLTMIWML